MPMRRTFSIGLLALLPGAPQAGAFVFADADAPTLITHPTGYTGIGGPRTINVCLRTAVLPTGVDAGVVEGTLAKALATWNAQRVDVANLALGSVNDIPAGRMDFESVLLHELGHCVGLAHVNHASESGFSDDRIDGTKSAVGANGLFDQGAGPDGLHGSADDVRGDDVSLYWYRSGSNDPLAFPAIIDQTTFELGAGKLPAGQTFARNADRDVLNSLGVANTESVMQQGQYSDEAQRRLTGEDMATLRLGMAGLDRIQGTADDYSVQLVYQGQQQNCDITVEFDPNAGFASCAVSGRSIGAGHHRITSAALRFAPGVNWHFSTAPNTITTITADTPDPSPVGTSYSVAVQVAARAGTVSGTPEGVVEIRDDLGQHCSATLSAGSGSCRLDGDIEGTRTLIANYLGRRGFDASSATATTHSVRPAGRIATLTITDTPANSVVGQPYRVAATVSGPTGVPGGSVTIDDGQGTSCSIALVAGSGECELTARLAATLSLRGVYSGDAVYESDEDLESHTVNPAATHTTIVSQLPSSTVAGEAYVVAVEVTTLAPGSGVPGGSVSVDDGHGSRCTAVLSDGAGQCPLQSQAAGSLTLSASYSGGGGFAPSKGSASHRVRAQPVLDIVSIAADASGSVATVTIALGTAPDLPAPTGTITIVGDAGAASCSVLLPGTSCDLTLGAVGTHRIQATYPGDENYAAAQDEAPLQVGDAPPLLSNGFESN